MTTRPGNQPGKPISSSAWETHQSDGGARLAPFRLIQQLLTGSCYLSLNLFNLRLHTAGLFLGFVGHILQGLHVTFQEHKSYVAG